MDRNSRSASDYRVIRNVTVVGSVVDGLLALGKLTGGIVAQSQALIADGIHSVSDLATDLLVILAARHSSQEADSEHPYGCLLYTSPSPRDATLSRMPSSA